MGSRLAEGRRFPSDDGAASTPPHGSVQAQCRPSWNCLSSFHTDALLFSARDRETGGSLSLILTEL